MFLKRGRKPVQHTAKGLLKMALFAIIVSSSVFPVGSLASFGTAAPQTAYAWGSCAIATAISNTVASATPSVGDTVTYTLNGAPAFTAETHEIVTDLVPSGLTFVSASASTGTYDGATGIWDLGTLNGANSITLVITATVNAGTEGQTITNTPSVKYIQSHCTASSAVTTATLTVAGSGTPTSTPAKADLSVKKTVDNATPYEGDTVHYTITVKDRGPATSTGAVATDTLPSGLTFENATASVGSYSSSTGVWTIGDMANGATATLAIAALVNASTTGATITNTATVGESASTTDCNLSNNSSSVSLKVQPTVATSTSADISIAKSVDTTSTVEGSLVNYTISVTDLGPATSTGVVATDTLPSGLTFVSATSSTGTYSSSTGAWTIGDLSPNATATLAIAATVKSGTANTTITNTAIVSETSTESDPNTANNSSSVSIAVLGSAPCSLTAAQFEAAVTSGAIDWNSIVLGTSTASFKITNHTSCTAPISLASWKMSVAQNGPHWLSTQQRFDVASTSLMASSTQTLTVNLPSCRTQVDAYYGQAPASLLDSNPYSYPNVPFNLAWTFANAGLPLCGATTSTSFSIAKTVDNASPSVGNTVNYTVTVNNTGFATSTGVVATDTLPSGLTFENATASAGSYASSTGAWTIGDMSPSSTAILTIAAAVNNGTAGTMITNIATVASSTASSTITVQGGGGGSTVADIGVNKTVDNAAPSAGDIVHYTVAVGDQGPDASTGVTVHDVLPSPALSFVSATTTQGSYSTSTGDWTVGAVAAHTTSTMIVTAKVAADQAGKTIANTATVTQLGSIIDNDPANNSSTVSIVVAPSTDANLAVSKTANVTSTVEGGTINYTISVTDLGPATSTGVVATDTLPSTLTYVSATSSVGSYASSTGTWTIGDLAASSTATLTIAATVNTGVAGSTGTTIDNTAIANGSASSTDPDPSNNSSTVAVFIYPSGGCGSGCPVADIAVNKTVDKANPNPGDTVNYTVLVVNNGPDAATIVNVHDQLPPTTALSLASATTSQGSSYNLSTGDWDVGTIAPNATATLMIAAVVGSNQAGNTIANTATVTELSSILDLHPENNSSTATIYVQSGGGGCTVNCGGGGTPTGEIAIVKTVDNANPKQGDTIHYTLKVTASGPSPSQGVVANDTLPSGVTLVSATTSIGTYDSATGVWTIGNMSNGQSGTLVITATVNASDTDGQKITNTGTVKESPAVNDQNSGNNTSSVTITVGTSGGGGTVLGSSTSTGQVLGASTCGIYLNDYIHPNRKELNDPNEVKKLQVFLNQYMGSTLPITGYYGPLTIAEVNQFQVKYHSEVLSSWVPLGLPTEFTPTNYVYETTKRWINLIMCPSLNIPMPALTVDNGE
ncbi:MAG: isopeptide-forming domain-containing fimbrial protein [Candidatus Pacebacteria bacterium]|nr:isopeptide-forming domain-containing fimbrial protein [Candidatus Paceibacterota bacterium]